MKRLLVVAALFAAFGAANAQKYEEKFDRFTGKRSWTFMDAPGVNTSPSVSSFIEMRDGKPHPFFILSVLSTRSRAGGSWQYLHCNKMAWLVDGAPFQLPDSMHDGRVIQSGVIEHIIQPMTLADMEKLATASSVEYKICNDEFAMTPAQMDGLRQVWSGYNAKTD